jgi:hypothetical protein
MTEQISPTQQSTSKQTRQSTPLCSGGAQLRDEMESGYSHSQTSFDPLDELRKMSPDELIKEGEDSLLGHIYEKAQHARSKYGTLTHQEIERFLSDPDVVRKPTRLIFEFGEMAANQFAQPEPDPRNIENAFAIYLRPKLRQHPELIPLAVSYVLPLINYGDIVTDHHCTIYGALLLGMTEDAYYSAICKMADLLGTEECSDNGQPVATPLSENDACGSGCGCSSTHLTN